MEEILNTDHLSDKEVTADTDPAELFADAGACVLSPEVTEGPLCTFTWVKRPCFLSPDADMQ